MGSHRVHGGWHPSCCRERSRHKSEQRPRHLCRTRDKSCSLPLHVLSLSRWPNLGLCSLPEITNLRIERALEGRPRGAAFDIRGETLLACNDVGVLQDSQHSRHHQITRSEAVTVKVGFVAKRLVPADAKIFCVMVNEFGTTLHSKSMSFASKQRRGRALDGASIQRQAISQ